MTETEPAKPDPKQVAKDLTKDVAKELERRKRRRRIIALAVWIAAIVAAVLYLRCGSGWGTGGAGPGSGGKQAGPNQVDPNKRCQLKVDAAGIVLGKQRTNREAAIEACKGTVGAEVTVTGDAREGDWAQLRAMLTAAHIDVIVHEPRGPAKPTAPAPEVPPGGSGSNSGVAPLPGGSAGH